MLLKTNILVVDDCVWLLIALHGLHARIRPLVINVSYVLIQDND